MKRKKLLVTASTFPRWEGDTEPRFIFDLSNYLSKYYDITILTPAAPGTKKNEKMDNIKVIRYHYFPIHKWETLCSPGAIVPRIKEKKVRILLVPFLFVSLYWQLYKIIPQYDLVHAHWLIPQGIVQSFLNIDYVITGHGGDVTSFNKGIFKYLKIRCLKKAKRIIVVSNRLKEIVQQLYPKGKIEVISMGCDTKKFGQQFRVENYFQQGLNKVVLFVGRLAEKKGVTYLIEAMKEVDAKLIIVGDGPLKIELEKQALRLNGKIEFWGTKTHEELKIIYASADVLVVPSITAQNGDMEGMPTTIIEAMASGIPVVASKTGGIEEIIKDNKNGILCEEKNISQLVEGINYILNNKEFREKLQKESIETVKKYDYQYLAQKFYFILNNCEG